MNSKRPGTAMCVGLFLYHTVPQIMKIQIRKDRETMKQRTISLALSALLLGAAMISCSDAAEQTQQISTLLRVPLQ